ncbi:hypothetical protein NCCP2222_39170 [Sporosarcina sp. NCCP-2222]|uniref:hypothetical protein n=1 Tax=Sporosarcina sp. NCCP-2222 TaxID=2935073 RepID=UPI00208C252C|nr:hypothetical protein [Sporosarcina sp. NCCP-2222]GKV57970.1 hypothetical protein NCCP2222_39170 [Sporosarcina sp. NCCP-2222]
MTEDKKDDHKKKTDFNTWTAYGDPVKRNPSTSKESNSPMLEKAKQDGNKTKNK